MDREHIWWGWEAQSITSQSQHRGLLLEYMLGLVAQCVNLVSIEDEAAVFWRLPLPRVQEFPQHRLCAVARVPFILGTRGKWCHYNGGQAVLRARSCSPPCGCFPGPCCGAQRLESAGHRRWALRRSPPPSLCAPHSQTGLYLAVLPSPSTTQCSPAHSKDRASLKNNS